MFVLLDRLWMVAFAPACCRRRIHLYVIYIYISIDRLSLLLFLIDRLNHN